MIKIKSWYLMQMSLNVIYIANVISVCDVNVTSLYGVIKPHVYKFYGTDIRDVSWDSEAHDAVWPIDYKDYMTHWRQLTDIKKANT